MSSYGYDTPATQYDDWDYNSNDWCDQQPPRLRGLFAVPPSSFAREPGYAEIIFSIISIPFVILALCFLLLGMLIVSNARQLVEFFLFLAACSLLCWGLYKIISVSFLFILHGLANLF